MEILIYIIMMVLTIVPLWKLCEQKKISPAWSLITIIPFGGLGLLWYLAFAQSE
jgi:heme/copper-type cytochrome/quinol oxidase subunit 4